VDDGKKIVFFGELLLRLTSERYERFVQAREFKVSYTGAETNAAISIANFGLSTFVVSAVPDNEIGDACINYIRQFGVNTDYIKRLGNRLGLLYVETGASQRPSKVIYDRAHSAIAELEPDQIDWDTIFAGKHWFHWSGTTPALSRNMAENVMRACMAAKKHGLTVSCDLNYRRKLWTPQKAQATMVGIMPYVDVLISGKDDATLMLGVSAQKPVGEQNSLDPEDCQDIMSQLFQRYKFKLIATTLREGSSNSENDWSALLFDGERCYASQRYHIWMVDRVSSGDAFSGGLIYGLLTGMDAQQSLEFAVAASCLKHSIHGDFNLVSKQEVFNLMKGGGSGRIQR